MSMWNDRLYYRDWREESYCPACAEPIDYCQGHLEIGDPAGYATSAANLMGVSRNPLLDRLIGGDL